MAVVNNKKSTGLLLILQYW